MVLPHYSGKRHHWLDTSSIVYLLWMVFGAFLAVIGLLFLFERLGLPQEVVHGGILVFAVAAVMFLAMIGKTMTGAYYFFCDRQAKASVIGFSSGTDWAGGTFFIFFLAASPALKHLLAPSLVLGMFLLSGLFAALFYRSGALTLPGFFFWRYQSSASGWVALLVTSLALFLLSLAELQVAAQMLPALGFSNQTAGLVILLGLALLPGLAGGWLSLMFVNVVLALWIIVAMTVPTFVVGFLPGVFTQDISDGPVRNLLTELPLPNLELTEPNSLLGSLTVIITLSCGFAVLPHALSRLALGRRSFAAIEHVGWGTLFVFVVLASFALSVGLLSSSGKHRQIGQQVQHRLQRQKCCKALISRRAQ